MQRVDRMDLEDEVGDMIERLSARKEAIKSSGVPTCMSSAMISAGTKSSGHKTDSDQMINDPAEADIGQAQRFLAVVRDEQGRDAMMRGSHPRGGAAR